MTSAAFDFIASVLLLEHPEGLSDEDRSRRLDFVLRFQQLTSPVMAKGLEDTAFYRWYPLASLNEVGGDPTIGGVSVDEFHRRNSQRLGEWPHSMIATATHDSKRGEDMRARLNVLSEAPSEWEAAVQRWQSMNESFHTEVEAQPAPDANEEYLLYQTLIGTWPAGPTDGDAWAAYVQRIVAYIDKAIKEAKLHTSWANPDEQYGQAMENFIRIILDRDRSSNFLGEMEAFVREVADAGWLNSLSQTVLKIFVPGLPDFYQGTELWDFHLVDPDNRGTVNFDHRRSMLAGLKHRACENQAGLLAELLLQWPDERIKMFVTWQALECRRRNAAACERGAYTPLTVEGARAEHVCAFARSHEGRQLLIIVPRLVLNATRCAQPSTNMFRPDGSYAIWWQETELRLPDEFFRTDGTRSVPATFRNALSAREHEFQQAADGHRSIRLTELFEDCPWAILERKIQQ
jgi:(1->4)-alpha-D-glucan 1-alpha-D-glucosylmutase